MTSALALPTDSVQLGGVKPPAAPPDVAQIVDHLFRRESGRLVAILARRFGVAHLHLAEDVVQDALLKAMQVWPFTGVPDNPSAWLLATAKNRALDQTRRVRTWRDKQDALIALVEDAATTGEPRGANPHFEDEIKDSQLRMMFVCCHPSLPRDAQVALILKTLCGFAEREIASAFLAAEDAIAKKLVRARKALRDAQVAIELPPAAQLAPRVEAVLHSLYLLFNEGYKASHGDTLLRADLCAEAIRLGHLLVAHPVGSRPETHALLALMHLHAARLPARTADDGSLLVLAAQDRTLWDRSQIRRGVAHLDESSGGSRVTQWHLEAGIAMFHALAPSYAETNWAGILELYDALLARDPSPIVALNRAVALAHVRGPEAGLRAVGEISPRRPLEKYHLLHAITGQLLLEAGRPSDAAAAFARALALAPQPAEREFLQRRLDECRH
jgi:RNA polymerase sigma factor (sigma-70 family)